jgi:hypothetical protein
MPVPTQLDSLHIDLPLPNQYTPDKQRKGMLLIYEIN